MGAWGPGIYQDDVALDIKDEYIELLKKGKTTEEAFKELINNNADYLEDEDAVPMLLALADTQWKYGRLNDMVKSDALNIINSGAGLVAWKYDKKLLKRRTEILEKLKEKLESPQPEEKKVSVRKFFDCGWKKNDVFAYQLKSEYAKKYGLYDRWLILIVDDLKVWEDHYVMPIVRAKITNNDEIPKTEDEINRLEYILIRYENYEGMFIFPKIRSKKQIEYNKTMRDKILELGKLPIYRFTIDNSSKRIIPKTLKYLGNYKKIRLPENEYIEFDKTGIWGVLWSTLEELILERYIEYNIGK